MCVQCVAQTAPYVGAAVVALGVIQHRTRLRREAGRTGHAEQAEPAQPTPTGR